jgi:hypothetical protein
MNTVTFRGKSGALYRFEAWPIDTKFKAVGGVYIVTSRTFEDRTFRTKASHRSLAMGQTSDLSRPLFTKSEMNKLYLEEANCICIYPVAAVERRASVEKDLAEANEQLGRLLYLVHTPVPPHLPGAQPQGTQNDATI